MLFMAAIGLGHLLLRNARRLRRTQALLDGGERAEALVVRVEALGEIGDAQAVKLLLEVRPRARPVYRVETKVLVTAPRQGLIYEGAVVAVKIDPQDLTTVALDAA